MAQQVGAFGYAMEIPLSGFEDLTDRVWRVIVTRPDLTSFERTSTAGDVEILDAEKKILGVRIKSGDWTIEGQYKLQLWDETDLPDANLRSTVRTFVVSESLTAPEE